MADVTKMVLVDLSEMLPAGDAQVIMRLSVEDRDTIDLARTILQVGQGDFVRTAAIKAAHKIISENGRNVGSS